MLVDADEVARGSLLEADVVVIGAGAAGITLARSLARGGVDVLLLESGDFAPDEATQALYEGEVVGHDHVPLDVTRLRYVGGTTNHWEGWCRPFQPIDLERREWVPHSGWPITYDELARWYPEAHEILQLGPVDYDAGSWASQHDIGTFQDDDDIAHTVFQFSPPTRFRERYGQELRDADRIRLVTNANLTRIEVSPDGARVDGLHVATLAGNAFRVRGRAHVLAAGALETARLLLSSDDVHAAGVGNQHDLVGRFFTEHPHSFQTAALDLPEDHRRFHGLHEVPGARLDGSSLQLLGVLAVSERARRESNLLGWTGEIWEGPEDDLAGVDALLGGLRGTPMPRTTRLTLRMEQAPNPDSRVVLGDDVDALGMRRLKLDWRFTEKDRTSLRLTMHLLARHFGARGTGAVRLEPDEGEWIDRVRPGNHQMGVARMSAHPQHGVVDADGRVHGVGNLWVSGGAVFPTCSDANPTLTIVALALRLAEHLRREVAS